MDLLKCVVTVVSRRLRATASNENESSAELHHAEFFFGTNTELHHAGRTKNSAGKHVVSTVRTLCASRGGCRPGFQHGATFGARAKRFRPSSCACSNALAK